MLPPDWNRLGAESRIRALREAQKPFRYVRKDSADFGVADSLAGDTGCGKRGWYTKPSRVVIGHLRASLKPLRWVVLAILVVAVILYVIAGGR